MKTYKLTTDHRPQTTAGNNFGIRNSDFGLKDKQPHYKLTVKQSGVWQLILMMVLITASISTIAQPLMVSKTVTHTTYGSSDGAISLTIDSGQSPFHYLWSTSDTTAGISGLEAGIYSVTVIDANDTLVLEMDVSTYAVWDIMHGVVETSEHVVMSDGSVVAPDSDVPFGLGFAGNVLRPDSAGIISFDFLPDSSFGGIVGLVGGITGGETMNDYVLPGIFPDSVGNLYLITDLNIGEAVFIGNWNKSESLQIKIVLTNDSVYLQKNGVEVYWYAYTRTTPIYPIFWPLLENSKVDAVTCNFKPLMPPVAPASQTVCSDTAYTFHFDSVLVGIGGDSIEWSLNSGFDSSHIIASGNNISVTVNAGSVDTVWMRSRIGMDSIVSRAVVSTAGVRPHPAPTPPAPKSEASDTAFTFVFPNIKGFYGSRIQWATDSAFAYANNIYSGDTIRLVMQPNTDSLIWLRNVDTVSGCRSRSVTSIAVLIPTPVEVKPYDTILYVCAGNALTYYVPATNHTKRYDFKRDTMVVSSAYGNDSTLGLSTGTVDSSAIFSIWATDTATNSQTFIDTGIAILVTLPVDTPVFYTTDTLYHIGDSVCYTAIARNSFIMRYSIVSGTAKIDSVTGYVDSVSTDFTIRATARGLTNCGSQTADLAITATNVAVPTFKAMQRIVVDTPQVVTVTFDSVIAGLHGNQIEWADNRDFVGSTILSSMAKIEFYAMAPFDTTIWIRSRNSSTSRVSKARRARAHAMYIQTCAGLLDKTNWTLNAAQSDEFNYSGLPGQNSAFQNKWAINYCKLGDCGFDATIHLENHTNWGNPHQMEYSNFNNDEDGSAGEVSFEDGKADLKATLFKDITGLPSPYQPHLPSGTPAPFDGRAFYYKSGMMFLRTPVSLSTPRLFEIRCKVPLGDGAWPGFWIAGTTELDFMERQTLPTEVSTTNVIDWTKLNKEGKNGVGCGKTVWKKTPCGYSDDWHTYSCVVTDPEIFLFIDGKEIRSITRVAGAGANTFPLIMNDPDEYLVVNLAMHLKRQCTDLDVESTCTYSLYDNAPDELDFLVDYVRSYDYNISSPTTVISLQDNATTLENPNENGQTGNQAEIPPAALDCITYQPILNERMSTIGTGNDIKIFYSGGPLVNIHNNFLGYMLARDATSHWYITPMGQLNNAPVPVVAGWMTPKTADLVYYLGPNNELKYFKKQLGNQWKSFNACDGNNPIFPIHNCAGYISVVASENIWYKGDDNDIWNWWPSSGKLNHIAPTSLGEGGMAVDASGQLIFYQDDDHKLHQMFTINKVWFDIVVVYDEIVKGDLVIDNDNSRIFFIGTDGAVYSYSWLYNNRNPDGLFRLGNHAIPQNIEAVTNNETLCGEYYNAESNLMLSQDKRKVYYKATDGGIWYYFDDAENSSFTPPGSNTPEQVSQGNWNKSPIKYEQPIFGPMAIEQADEGRLFYATVDRAILVVEPMAADNPIVCDFYDNPDWGNTSSFKTDGSEAGNREDGNNVDSIPLSKTIAQSSGVQVHVYPNPSQNKFILSFTNLDEASAIEIKIEDISGRVVYETKTDIPLDSKQYQMAWNAENMNAGVYIYSIKVNKTKIKAGKLFKM